MTNAERQRKFQRLHPGYDRRRKATERAGAKRAVEIFKRAQRLEAARAQTATEAEVTTPPEQSTPVRLVPANDPIIVALRAMPVLRSRETPAEPLPPT
jgi:hypothetical protein